MDIKRIEELMDEFDEAAVSCGDNEYIHLQHIRCDLAEYADAMRKAGPGTPRKGYVERELT